MGIWHIRVSVTRFESKEVSPNEQVAQRARVSPVLQIRKRVWPKWNRPSPPALPCLPPRSRPSPHPPFFALASLTPAVALFLSGGLGLETMR